MLEGEVFVATWVGSWDRAVCMLLLMYGPDVAGEKY
jgi:hypothetical protein